MIRSPAEPAPMTTKSTIGPVHRAPEAGRVVYYAPGPYSLDIKQSSAVRTNDMAPVIYRRYNSQVLQAIIILDAVDGVNLLLGIKIAANFSFHDQSMPEDIFASPNAG